MSRANDPRPQAKPPTAGSPSWILELRAGSGQWQPTNSQGGRSSPNHCQHPPAPVFWYPPLPAASRSSSRWIRHTLPGCPPLARHPGAQCHGQWPSRRRGRACTEGIGEVGHVASVHDQLRCACSNIGGGSTSGVLAVQCTSPSRPHGRGRLTKRHAGASNAFSNWIVWLWHLPYR